MPELQEVFQMATQKVRPDPGARERQRQAQRHRAARRKVGTIAVAAAIGALAVIVAALTLDRGATTEPMGRPLGEALGYAGLPPEGAEPSSPERGELVLRDSGIHPWCAIHVYADGRVISLHQIGAGTSNVPTTTGWLERRATPEGIDLLRSGLMPSELPQDAWEDPVSKPFVPWKYVVCLSEATLGLLPQRAQDLLRDRIDDRAVVRGEVDDLAGGPGFACPVVTIEEARVLDAWLVEAGWERGEHAGELTYGIPPGQHDAGTGIAIIPLLPNGRFEQCCPG